MHVFFRFIIVKVIQPLNDKVQCLKIFSWSLWNLLFWILWLALDGLQWCMCQCHDHIFPRWIYLFILYLFIKEEVVFIYFQGYGVVLVNTDEAGTLLLTNFRLLFLVSDALYWHNVVVVRMYIWVQYWILSWKLFWLWLLTKLHFLSEMILFLLVYL